MQKRRSWLISIALAFAIVLNLFASVVVFAEAKGNGYDVKVMRQILRLRKMTPADRAEAEYLRDEYKKLLGIAE